MRADQNKHPAGGKLKSSLVKEFFKDGTLSSVGKYRDGKKVGGWEYYLWNGLLKAAGKYSRGKLIGGWQWFRENGKLMQTGSLEDEKKTGVWKRHQTEWRVV